MDSSNINDTEFVARLIAKSYAQNKDIATAIGELHELKEPFISNQLVQLEKLFQEHKSWALACNRWAPSYPLGKMLEEKDFVANRIPVIQSALLAKDQLITALITKIVLTLGYLVLLLVVATIISGISSVFVVGAFDEVFSGFNAELPIPTQFVMDYQEGIFTFMTLLILLFSWITMSIKRNPMLKALPNWLVRLTPGIGSIYQKACELEQAIVDLGSPQRLEKRNTHWAKRIAVARHFDLDEELMNLYIAQHMSCFEEQVQIRTRTFTLVAQLLVVLLIANMLLAFYLPIFSLGEVI